MPARVLFEGWDEQELVAAGGAGLSCLAKKAASASAGTDALSVALIVLCCYSSAELEDCRGGGGEGQLSCPTWPWILFGIALVCAWACAAEWMASGVVVAVLAAESSVQAWAITRSLHKRNPSSWCGKRGTKREGLRPRESKWGSVSEEGMTQTDHTIYIFLFPRLVDCCPLVVVLIPASHFVSPHEPTFAQNNPGPLTTRPWCSEHLCQCSYVVDINMVPGYKADISTLEGCTLQAL